MRLWIEHAKDAVATFFELPPNVHQGGILVRGIFPALAIELRNVRWKKIRRKAKVNVHQLRIENRSRLGVGHIASKIAGQPAAALIGDKVLLKISDEARECSQRLSEKLRLCQWVNYNRDIRHSSVRQFR